MSEHDHDYTLTVRPNATLRVAYSTADGTLEEALVALEYGHDGVKGMSDADEGIEWRGYEIALARDGESVLDRGTQFVDADDLERGVGTATEYGRRLKRRVGAFREQRASSGPGGDDGTAEAPKTVEIPGPSDTTVGISLTETAATFDLYEDDGGNWRWRLNHREDTLAVSSTGYESREAAEETITALKANALGADIEG